MRAPAAALAVALLLGGCAPRLWDLPPPPVIDAPVVDAGRLTTADLENGLRVIVLTDRRLPRVSLGLIARRGADSVPIEHAGLASLSAELMKRGAGDWDAVALAEQIDRLGASLAVSAGWDSMEVAVSGLSRDFDRLLEILTAVVRRPRFDAPEVESARSQRLASLEQAKDEPATLAFWNLARALYPEHRFGIPIEGAPASVAGLDAAALRAYHARVFVARNAILFASGDVEGAAFVSQARSVFGDWPAGEVPEPGPPPPTPTPPERSVVIVDRPDLGQAQILLGHDGIARTNPDRIAVEVMNTILGSGGFSSRLMQRIRAEGGLTYGVYSAFTMRRQPGPFFVSAATRVAEAGRVVDLILEEMSAARDAAPTPDEVQSAKSGIAGRFVLGLETSDAVVGSLVNLDVYGLPADSLDTFRGRLGRVGVGDVQSAARERLWPERAAIVAVGPAESLRPLLERFGPVRVVEP
ncbi:MAG: insulinase family protein [Deltaproteobacteria bacterium]|nr:MAG: insulinase family protein [Deltaproteobacteria bacterium]